MKKKSALDISNEIGMSFPKELTLTDLPDSLDKALILEKMKQRLAILEDRHNRDFSGGLQTELGNIRELRIWIGKIERGEFDLLTRGDT